MYNVARGNNSDLLDEEAHGCDFIQHAELALGVLTSNVNKHTFALDKQLVDIRHHAACVSELVGVAHPVVE